MAWFIAGFLALRVLGIAFFVLLIARIVAGVGSRHYDALGIVGRRFADGEITEEQFRRIREVLQSD